MKPVTDPNILNQSNGGMKPVSDPNLLAQLEGKKPTILQRAKGWVKDAAEGMMVESDMAAEATKVPLKSVGRGAMKGYAKTADTALGLVGALAPQGSNSPARKLQENITEPAVKYWTKQNPSTAEQVGEGLGEIGSAVTFGPGAIPVMAGNATYQTGKELIEAGATVPQAQKAGAIQGAAMAAMGAIPAAGKTIPKTVALATANPAIGAASRAATQKVLEDNPELAKQFDPLNPVALGMDVASAGLAIPAHLKLRAQAAKARPVTDPTIISKLEEAPETPRPTHENLGEGVTAKDSLAVPPEVKPVVKGTTEEMSALQSEGALEGRVLHQKGDAVYAIDPKAVDVEQAKVAIEQGGDAESAVLGYPPRDAVPVEQRADAAVTKQGEVITDLPTMKAETEAGNVAWAAEGEKGAVEAQAKEVAGAVKGDTVVPPEQPPILPETPITGNIAAGSLAYGQELPKYAGNINLDRVGADYSVKKLILDTSDQYKPMIDESRRGVITHEETKALADDLGMTVEDLLKRRKGQAFNAEEVTAARDILNTSATRLNDMRAKAAELGSDEALIEFRKAFDTHALIQAEVSGAAAEAGRALSAHRMSSSPSKNYKAMLDALGGREVNEAILRRFGEVDVNNVQEVNRFIKEFTRVKKRSMIYEAWISFLLSGVKTHVVNTVSNVLTFGTKPLETLAVSGVEAVRRTVKGDPRTRFVGEMKHELIGAKAGISDGVTGALRAWREELPADTLVKFDSPSPYGGAIPGKTGKIIRIPLRLLSAADEFMKSVVYTGEIYGQSYRQARIEGLTGEQLKSRMVDLVSNPSEKIRKIAHHEAEYRTFTQPLGPYANKINSLRQLPGGRVLVPFFRTLTNIAKFGLERTPFNFARLAIKIRKGELKGAQISDELAKPILGTLIAAAVVELSSQGMITGGGPKKKEDRETLFRSGWQPYSFKVGDKYIPFGRIEPIGTIFGMSADFVEIANSGADDKTLSDYAEAISLSFTKNLLSKTFVTGVSNALDAVTDPKRYGAAWIKSQAGSLVPSISANVAQVVDPVMRQTNSPLDAMQARVPYLSQNLPAKVDIWGREIKRAGNAFERAVSPSPVTESTKDPVDLEVTRLGMSVGLPKKQIGKVKLSPYEYEIYAKRSGQRAYNHVSRLVGVGMSDESKIKAIERAISNARTIEGKKLLRELRK